LPGAGEDINNPQLFGAARVVFDRETANCKRQIFFYDVVGELLVDFNDVNGLGSVKRPSISADGTVMTFILEGKRHHEGDGGGDAGRGSGGGGDWGDPDRAMIWINGVVADLAKVNAIGADHCGVKWIRLSCDGHWAVFTTGDGQLYVYDVINPTLHQVTEALVVGDGFASHPAISPDGSQIAFASGDGRVYRYDRIAGLVDPMPFLNRAFNAEYTTDPMWECTDNAHIYVEQFIHPKEAQCVERVTEYNWLTETVAALTVLNGVDGTGFQAISDLDQRP
jgi:WD40 repeat protein